MIGVLSSFGLLLALGAHVVVPGRLAGARSPGHEERRRVWALTALPLLLISATTSLVWLSWSPDALIGAGWATDLLTVRSVRATVVLLLMLALADLLLLFAHSRLEPRGWLLLSLAGWPALAAGTLFLEILRVGQGPRTTAGALALAVVCRSAATLGAGEALAPSPRRRWASWTLAAGALLPFYPLALPSEVRSLLWDGGDVLTLGAGSLLFLLAPGLPVRLQRPAILGAALLAALVFARATELAKTFPVHLRPLPGL